MTLEDTQYQSTMDATLATYADLGFEAVLHDTFVGNSFSDAEGPAEDYYLLWHSDGILGEVESFNTVSRNRSNIFYNLRRTDSRQFYYATGSGHFHGESYDKGDHVWIGENDMRQGMRAKMERLRGTGQFVVPWIEVPIIGLTTYAENNTNPMRSMDYAAWRSAHLELTQARIDRLPDSVRDSIGSLDR